MTYKELVDRIKDIAWKHNMIVDFGYGNLSDIKVRAEGEDGNSEADYPYLFLNPTNHTRTQQSITYRFNMIIMDLTHDDNYLKVQSEAMQYIDDVVSRLRFGYSDSPDVLLNYSVTPFKERFQDEVAGMTAVLEIEIANPLVYCDTPFTDNFSNLIVWLGKEESQVLVPGGSGTDYITIPPEGRFINEINGPSAWWNVNRIQVGEDGYRGRVELKYTMRFVPDSGTFIAGPIIFGPNGGVADEIVGFPSEYDTNYHDVTQVWEDLTLTSGPWYFFAATNQPGDEYDLELTNVDIKLYR
jgi:hypothetical protein